jgi:hypothetical protein
VFSVLLVKSKRELVVLFSILQFTFNMTNLHERNVKTFNLILNILNCFGVTQLKSYKPRKLELLSRLLSFVLMTTYLWLLLSNVYNDLYLYKFPLAKHSSDIDRSSKIVVVVIILFDATFNRKRSLKLSKTFDEIDELLLEKFKLKFDYKKITQTFIFLTGFNLIPVFLMLRQYSPTMTIFRTSILIFYTAGNLMLQTMETFYIAIVIHFLIRCKTIEIYLRNNGKKLTFDDQQTFEELLFKFFKLINAFNRCFGFIALVFIGKNNEMVKLKLV